MSFEFIVARTFIRISVSKKRKLQKFKTPLRGIELLSEMTKQSVEDSQMFNGLLRFVRNGV